jgi:hypothetical protein
MTKAQLIAAVQAKTGFVSIIKDELARDHVPGDTIEKRFLYVNHINADSTAGKKYVYYLHDTVNDTAWFYNVEEALDNRSVSSDQQKLDALQDYLKINFNAYFVNRFDITNQWAEADVYTLNTGKLTKKTVIVYKNGTNPIAHLDVA